VEIYEPNDIVLQIYNVSYHLNCGRDGYIQMLHLVLVSKQSASTPSDVQGMTLNCIHIFIVTGSFLY